MAESKKGLVLEGGGIRSAYLAGVLLAFHDREFNHFDVVAGTSAGACCGANFIAGEPEKNKIILEDYLTGNRFVSYRNVFSKRNVVDIDYLVDEVCTYHVPFSLEKIKNAGSLLYISAVDYLTGEVSYFNNREHNIHEAIRASCAMPYLYRKKAVYDGRRYLDGGLLAGIPLEKVLESGCEEIVVISTRHQGYRKPKDRIPAWIHRFTYSDSSVMAEIFKNRSISYNKCLDQIKNPPKGIKIHFIVPRERLPVARVTRDRGKVQSTVKLGYEDGLGFLKIITP